MSNPRLEILKMVAEGKLSPEDGDRLIKALNDGSGGDGNGGVRSNFGRALDDAAQAVKSAATEGVRAVQKVFEEHRPGTEPVMPHSGSFDLPAESTLRIQPAFRVSIGGTSAGGSVVLRGVDTESARIVKGSAVEIHRYENEYVLTWAKSQLELEVPRNLENLFIRGFGGDIRMTEFDGSFRLEGLGGNFDIEGIRRPFRIRSVGGSVRIRDLAVTEGSSHITTTGGDVEIDTAAGASVEIKASTSLGGSLVLPDGAAIIEGRTRRKGTVRIGSAIGALRIDTVAGWVRVRSDAQEAQGGATYAGEAGYARTTAVRDAAGDAMGDPAFDTSDDSDDTDVDRSTD